jgi:hypothetical protein
LNHAATLDTNTRALQILIFDYRLPDVCVCTGILVYTAANTLGGTEGIGCSRQLCERILIDEHGSGGGTGGTDNPAQRVLDYVKSDIKWQLGFRHEPYNKISGFTMDHLSKALEAKDLSSATHIDEGCCKVMLELLQVSTRQAIIKDPGIDVAANIIVTDAKGKMVFFKGYRGRSGTHFMNTWGHLIDSACENLVDNIAKDDVLVAVLRTGKLPD